MDEKQLSFPFPAALKTLRGFPDSVKADFGYSLRCIQFGSKPELPTKGLDSVGKGVFELKINGSPAYRCVYVANFNGKVVVLHAFTKTTNGVHKPAMDLAKKRYKELVANPNMVNEE